MFLAWQDLHDRGRALNFYYHSSARNSNVFRIDLLIMVFWGLDDRRLAAPKPFVTNVISKEICPLGDPHSEPFPNHKKSERKHQLAPGLHLW